MGRTFYLAEIEAYRYGVGAVAERGWMTRPHLTGLPSSQPLESTITICVSDLGWLPGAGDPNQVVYAPLMERAFEIDRRLNLSPLESGAAAAWGSLRLLNADGIWDSISSAMSPDGRLVRVLMGEKIYNITSGVEIDPAYETLTEIFSGVATSWFLGDGALEVPLRDASYFFEHPLQSNLYAGTGGLEGPSGMKGVPKPKTRGGSSTNPVQNVSPVLVDPTNRIYQYNDGPGTVVQLFEGGDTNIVFDSDTSNLYSGSTPPGKYRTDNSKGLFQLGSSPVRQITANVTGRFPSGATLTDAPSIIRYLILEDLGIDPSFLDTSNLTSLSATWSQPTGWYYGPQQIEGAEAVAPFLRCMYASLVPTRNRKLKVIGIKALDQNTIQSASWDDAVITEVVPRRLSSPLDPPAFRWYVGYNMVNSVQTNDLSPNVSDARKQLLAKAWSQAGWSSASIFAAYRRPSDPPIITSAHLSEAGAQAAVDLIGSVWGARRRYYDVTVPFEVGIRREVGDIVKITYPLDDLASGRIGQIVGEQIRSNETTITFQVLV